MRYSLVRIILFVHSSVLLLYSTNGLRNDISRSKLSTSPSAHQHQHDHEGRRGAPDIRGAAQDYQAEG